MRNIILFIFYTISVNLLLISYVSAYSSADFDETPQYSAPGYFNDEQVYEHRHEASQPNYNYSRTRTTTTTSSHHKKYRPAASYGSYVSRLSPTSGYGEKVIVINPRKHVWGAYAADGKLLRAGLATAGSSWCPDIHRACRTRSGSFRIFSLGSRSCYSKRYPVGRGGAPMPYCMFFNGNQGLHGSHEIAEANLSHGCVRISVGDAEWVRFNFANIGTKVVVMSY